MTADAPARPLLRLATGLALGLYVPRAVAAGLAVALASAAVGTYFVLMARTGACGRCGIDWNALYVVAGSGALLALFPRRVGLRVMVLVSMVMWAGASLDLHRASAATVRANEARMTECVDGERSYYVAPGPGGRSRVMPDCIVKLPTILGMNGSDWSVATMRFALAVGLVLIALEALLGVLVLIAFVKLKREKAASRLDAAAP